MSSGYDIHIKVKDGVPYVIKKTIGETYASCFATAKTSMISRALKLDERPIALSKTAWNKMKADRRVTIRLT